MSEVKNEGLEVVAFVNDAAQAGITLTGSGFSLTHGEELCRHSEALAGYAVRDAEAETWKARAHNEAMLVVERDARIAELEAKTRTAMGVGSGSGNLFVYGDYDSIKAAQKIVIERDQLRAELAAIKGEHNA